MPAAGPIADTISPAVGLMYIFNLIVGTGALTMPKAFSEAGWLLSLVVVIILSFISYLTATFMVEAMASANALVRFKTLQHYKRVSNQHDPVAPGPSSAENDLVVQQEMEPVSEDPAANVSLDSSKTLNYRKSTDAVVSVANTNNVDYFAITESFEMGKMANMFYNVWGVRLFYLCIAIYLYGDLAIYATAVAKSLRDVACVTVDSKRNDTESLPCWNGHAINRSEAYRLFLVIFIGCVGPFTFFNVQKTKYLQISTTLLRWKAFICMIVLCLIAIIGGKNEGSPKVADFMELPNLFGVCVYSFMCHHSLPSLLTPIQPKRNIYSLVAADFVLILVFYNLLCFTGIFTFSDLKDMFNMNFEPGASTIVPQVVYLQYFLLLFPVLTLSSNFPIIAITLRNNLAALFLNEESSWILHKIVFPLIAIVPPVLVALLTENVEILVGFTGSYAGAIIQYVVPATLVYFARKDVLEGLGLGMVNSYASPFKGVIWIYFVMGWTATCILFVTIRHCL